MRQREDGSVESSSYPSAYNQRSPRDYGVYCGIVRSRYAVDDDNNPTTENTKEIVYDVQIVGGSRDGQLVQNCRTVKKLGGRLNAETYVYKATDALGGVDPTSLAYIVPIEEQNGDFVYITFLDGNAFTPLILGAAMHPGSVAGEGVEEDGTNYTFAFNGFSKAIASDGVVTYVKATGSNLGGTPVPSTKSPLSPYINEFVATPGLEEAVKVEIDNAQKITLTFATGGVLELDGLGDSYKLTTASGMEVAIDAVGDSIKATTVSGAKVELSGSAGVLAQDAAGNKLTMGSSEVSLVTASGGKFKASSAGLLEVGNSTGDALKLMGDLLQTLSTDTFAGFGAPATSAPIYAQLAVKLKLITG